MSKISETKLTTTSDMRRFLSNLALGVVQGDVDTTKAAVAVKACKEINTSLYSEIKCATAQVALGREVAALGDLPLTK